MGNYALRLHQMREGNLLVLYRSETRGRKRAELRANRIEEAPRKASWPHPSAPGQRAEFRTAERAATALLRAMEDNTRFPAAFVLDEEDPTIGPAGSQVACGSDAIGCSRISVGHDRD